jgi:hypothetical protein
MVEIGAVVGLLIVFVLLRPLVQGTLLLFAWALCRVALSERWARKACGHYYDKTWRQVFRSGAIPRADQEA